MRADEFTNLNETKEGKLKKVQRFATRGLHKFRDETLADRVYELNRIMMAAAATDGTFLPDMDHESWAGRYDIAAPYTEEEHNMLKMAYKVNGTEYKDLNKGDLRSQEHPTTNTQSVVKPFKGYKKK
jgi:hypothetical protein